MKNALFPILLLLVASNAFALPNDKFGRTVTLVSDTQDNYTDVDPNNGNSTFVMSFPLGTAQTFVYSRLESQAPPGVKNYAGLDATSAVVLIQIGVTQAIMDALVSGGTIASYAVLDPNFPPPPLGAVFVSGAGQGNFGTPAPYLANNAANWPPPGGVPNIIPQAVDQLANRLSTINPSTPARTLNSNFTPNANRPVYACYTIHLSCSITLGQTCTAQVQFLSDTNATPSTVRSQTTMTLGGTLLSGLTTTNTHDTPVCYIVPKGHNVRLASSSAGTGTASSSITQQTEEPLM